jgi:hypothetical protein
LQRQLNVFADPVIDINRRRIEGDLARTPLERDREIDLELSGPGVPGSSVIIGGPPCPCASVITTSPSAKATRSERMLPRIPD